MVREGLVAGLLGAGAVAVWFLLIDAITGRPLYTPAVLGSVVFLGLRDTTMVVISFQTVMLYSAITPLLAALAWASVAVGNLIAAASMGYYLWRARPALRQALC